MNVEWKPVPVAPDAYEASTDGRIRNLATGRELRPQDNGRGRLIVTLYISSGARLVKPVSAVILETFHPEGKRTFDPEIFKITRHRNGIYTDCSLANLCWDTRSGVEWRSRVKPMLQRPVVASGYLEFPNSVAAGIELNLSDAQIEMVCMDPNDYISYGGHTWRWA